MRSDSRASLLVEILAILVVHARHELRRHLRELARVDSHERRDATELVGGIGAEILICQFVQIDTFHERFLPFQSLDFEDMRLPVESKPVDQGFERPPNATRFVRLRKLLDLPRFLARSREQRLVRPDRRAESESGRSSLIL